MAASPGGRRAAVLAAGVGYAALASLTRPLTTAAALAVVVPAVVVLVGAARRVPGPASVPDRPAASSRPAGHRPAPSRPAPCRSRRPRPGLDRSGPRRSGLGGSGRRGSGRRGSGWRGSGWRGSGWRGSGWRGSGWRGSGRRRTALAWGAVVALTAAVELLALAGQPAYDVAAPDHPTISLLLDPLTGAGPTRFAAWCCWLGLGRAVLRR